MGGCPCDTRTGPGTLDRRAGTRGQASGAQTREVTQDAAVTQTVQLVQQVLAAPEVAFCLIALGLFAVTVWLAMPALTTAGLVGAVLLVAGGASLAVARTSWAALVVLVLVAASLCFEARFVPGVGLYGHLGLVRPDPGRLGATGNLVEYTSRCRPGRGHPDRGWHLPGGPACLAPHRRRPLRAGTIPYRSTHRGSPHRRQQRL
jgi:hypothetical protein